MKKSVIIGIVIGIIVVVIIGIIIIMYVGNECKTDSDCLTKYCFTEQCKDNKCIYSPIFNCCGNEICEVNETYLKCAVDCPSCEDYNDCTIDSYDYHEQKCANKVIIPCCGNEICDENTETYLNCSTDCPDCDDNNKLTEDSFNYATQECENPVTHYFIDDFEEGTENWDFTYDGDGVVGTGWSTIEEDGNTVLKGTGHNWANLQGKGWDNYIFKFRFKMIKDGLHVNFRVSSYEGGITRYYVLLREGKVELRESSNPLDKSQGLRSGPVDFNFDKDWHTFEIRGYNDILNIYIDDELLIKIKDTDSPLLSGRAAFESNGEFLIDDVEIKLIAEEDIIYP